MSGHALFSPSAAHRWIKCPGSFAYPGNTADSESSEYADDGTASHEFAAWCLKRGKDAAEGVGRVIPVNGKRYTVDEERAEYVQAYLDVCRQLAFGKLHFVEHWVDTSEWLGEGQGGTADFVVIDHNTVTVVDLKYGMGERVEASYQTSDSRDWPNEQLGLYGAGALRDAQLLGYNPKTVRLVICQPRLGHISEMEFDVIDILALCQRAKAAVPLATKALVSQPADVLDLMRPDEKTCRWCKARSECPKLFAWAQEQVRADFDEITAQDLPALKPHAEELSRAYRAVNLVRQWCDAVEAATFTAVDDGRVVMGSDGKPLKIVEGRQGKRKWADPGQAEAALVGQLGEKAYEPRAIITAPAAAKLLDKKKTKALWTDMFAGLITRSPGRPTLALGSDTRPEFKGGAAVEEFSDADE